jgi:hypothetical protein
MKRLSFPDMERKFTSGDVMKKTTKTLCMPLLCLVAAINTNGFAMGIAASRAEGKQIVTQRNWLPIPPVHCPYWLCGPSPFIFDKATPLR